MDYRKLDVIEVEELICALLNLKRLDFIRCDDFYEKKLRARFGIGYNDFCRLLCKLMQFVPLTENAEGNLVHSLGMDFNGLWCKLVSVPATEEEIEAYHERG